MESDDGTFRAAAILDEIVRHADPLNVLRKQIVVGEAGVAFRMLTEPNGQLMVSYFYPCSVVMSGVEGTPEQVIEWLKTGLQPGQEVRLIEERGERYFEVMQVHDDPDISEDAVKLMRHFMRKTYERLGRTPPKGL